MPRHNFRLTDETIKVFNGSAKVIAEEADVSDKYIHAILAGSETDPFAPFQFYYAAAVRAGKDVSPYDNRLALIRAKYDRSGLCHREETAKLGMETADVARVVLTDAPLYAQLVEATQARDQAERTVKAIMDAINAEKDQVNGHRSRLPIDIQTKARRRRG
jgi:hypothetical protein